jgi:DNA-binding transcriptional ArsR family regulator
MNAAAALGALAEEDRLEIFRLLIQAGREGMAAGQVAEKLRLTEPDPLFCDGRNQQPRQMVPSSRSSSSFSLSIALATSFSSESAPTTLTSSWVGCR